MQCSLPYIPLIIVKATSNAMSIVGNALEKFVDSKLVSLNPFSIRINFCLGVIWLSGNLVGISINLCKSKEKEFFINDTP